MEVKMERMGTKPLATNSAIQPSSEQRPPETYCGIAVRQALDSLETPSRATDIVFAG